MTDDIWENDKLGRKDDAVTIERFLTNRFGELRKQNKPATFVMNLDSDWGGGKTFFLDCLAKFLRSEDGGNHICVEINAWKDDFSDDPLPYFTSEICRQVKEKIKSNEQVKKAASKVVRSLGKITVSGAIKQLAKKAFGDDATDEIVKELTSAAVDTIDDAIGNAIMENVNDQKNAIEEFNTFLSKFAASANSKHNGPIYILVDELDRCRPNYAVALLERIKHFFAVDGIVFLIATDTKQLANAIKGVYGNEFDGKTYLQRFFDRTYFFPEPKLPNFIAYEFARHGLTDADFLAPPDHTATFFLAQTFSEVNAKLRTIKKLIEILATTKTLQQHNIPINLCMFLICIDDSNIFGDLTVPFAKVSFKYRNRHDGTPETTKSTIAQARQLFPDPSTPKFFMYLYKTPAGILQNWVFSAIRQEREARNINMNSGPLPTSVLNDYPDLIRSLQALTKE